MQHVGVPIPPGVEEISTVLIGVAHKRLVQFRKRTAHRFMPFSH